MKTSPLVLKLAYFIIILICLQSQVVYSAAPTIAATNLSFTNVQGDKMTLNWTNGNGARRIVIFKQGSAVTATPTNGTSYSMYTNLGNGNLVVYNGTGSSFTFQNTGSAAPTINTAYYFAIFEYNGTGTATEYLTSPNLTGNQTTLGMADEPTYPVTQVTFPWKYEETMPNLTTRQKIGISWTGGTGTGTLVIVRQGSPIDPSVFPADGSNINQWANLGNGHIVCYKGAGSYFEFKSNGTGILTPDTRYYFAFIEYNGTTVTTNYLTSSYKLANTYTLATRPTVGPSNLSFTSVQSARMTLNWTNGNGSNRLIIAKAGSAPAAVPIDGISYGQGQTIATGETVIYNGTGSQATFASLASGVTYYFAIYEFSGSSSTSNYFSTSPLTGSQATLTASTTPTVSASNLIFTNVQPDRMTLNWTNGNGTNRIIVARTGSAVTAIPTNGVTYSQYQSISPGQIVVYNGAGNSFTYSNTGSGVLTAGTTYHFAIYEYNGGSTTEKYLISPNLIGSRSTSLIFTEPTVAASNLIFTNVLSNKMTLNWTNGNGTNRLVVFRKNSPVTFTPTDGVSYSTYQSVGSGNIIIYNNTGNSFTFSNDGFGPLPASTLFYFAIFEYTGTGSSINYLTSANLTGSQSTSAAASRISALSLDQTSTDRDLQIYPNPASGNTNFALYNNNLESEQETMILQVYNTSGNHVSSKSLIYNEVLNLDISTLPSGVYYVRVSGKEFTTSKTLLVE